MPTLGRMDAGSARRTATLRRLAPWIAELARTLPGLVDAYLPGAVLDPRTRERVILAVTEVNGCRSCAWIHGSWQEFLGGDELVEAELALLAHARACAEAGRPLDASALSGVLPPEALRSVRATIARTEVANLAGNSAEALLARLSGRLPRSPLAALAEAATVAVVAPVTAPLAATAALMRLASRLAPPRPVVAVPSGDEGNLLAHLLGEALGTWLSNAAVRLVLLDLPVTVGIGVRAGRTTATVRVGRGAVSVVNGITADAIVVVEGDVDPLLRLASGAILRELGAVRLRPST